MKYNDNGEYKDIYIKTFDTLPVGAEVDYDGDSVPDGWEEVGITDFQSKVTFNETIGSWNSFKKCGNIIAITFQGENKGHSANDLLFTLPSEYRPSKLVGTIFATDGTYGKIALDTDGTCKVASIVSSSQSGRIMFNLTYFID